MWWILVLLVLLAATGSVGFGLVVVAALVGLILAAKVFFFIFLAILLAVLVNELVKNKYEVDDNTAT